VNQAAPGSTSPRVLIVDDEGLVRTGFRMILKATGIEVVGEAADGAEALEAVRRLMPDVVLMDIRMPRMDGLQALPRVLEIAPRCRVIMLTTFDLDRYVYAALEFGASGFLLKEVTAEHLSAAVRLVATGDALLAPSITRRLVERFASGDKMMSAEGRRPSADHQRDLAKLTAREIEVLTLVGRGLSNAEMADTLTLSEATVKTHIGRIFSKLGLRDRAQAVVLAYETGLVRAGVRDEA
jgi:DNA-binding NarL/FixJ family response regulator